MYEYVAHGGVPNSPVSCSFRLLALLEIHLPDVAREGFWWLAATALFCGRVAGGARARWRAGAGATILDARTAGVRTRSRTRTRVQRLRARQQLLDAHHAVCLQRRHLATQQRLCQTESRHMTRC